MSDVDRNILMTTAGNYFTTFKSIKKKSVFFFRIDIIDVNVINVISLLINIYFSYLFAFIKYQLFKIKIKKKQFRN